MIAFFDQMQRRAIAEFAHDLLQQIELCELVARPLKK